MGIFDDPQSLMLTKPLFEFGLSTQGIDNMQSAGFWPTDRWEQIHTATKLQIAGGVDEEDIQKYCNGIRNEYFISMAGSSTVFPVARIWSEIYSLVCPAKIPVEGGGSSVGVARVCGNKDRGYPVDIGTMSRDWKQSEAKEHHEYVYECLEGDTSRSAIKVDVAYDGMTIILPKGGDGDQCLSILGGFTVDQLRWIFSSYSDADLADTGWDPTSILNSDNNPTTHKWSELDSRCSDTEIRLAGDKINEGTHSNFKAITFADAGQGEDISQERPHGYFQGLGYDLVSYVQEHQDSVAYIGFNYFFNNQETLSAAAIKNDAGDFVLPSATTIGDGSYNPYVRNIHMNLLNDPESLRNTIPLLQFGFSQPDLVTAIGFVPVQGEALEEMLSRLQSFDIQKISNEGSDDDDDGLSLPVLIVVSVIGGLLLLCCFVVLFSKRERW
jgi:phosphate transport system substrate-binding protein